MVSAIVPCHNYGRYLDFSIKSILGQTYKDIEVIVVNDGSTDDFTVKKLEHYNMPKTQVVHRPQGYPAAARNTGFAHAKGEYILILDSDDLLESTFVAKAINVMETDAKVGAVSAEVLNFGYTESIWRPSGGGIESFMYKINCGSAGLIRRKAWEEAGGFNENFIEGYEDWNFWIDITKRGWTIYIIPELLFYYRTKEHSRVTDTVRVHEKIYQMIQDTHPEVFKR